MKTHSQTRRWQGGGTLLGLVFGLLVGVLISFGVVWTLNKTPLPFVEKVPRPEHNDTDHAAKTPVPLPGKPGDKPIERKFEFYDILEGKKPVTPGDAPSSAAPAVPAKPEAAPAPATQATPPSPTAATGGGLFLQVGAFQKATDADRLKAQLAMLGFEAGVLEVEVPDKGKMHRVRVGPYATPEEMNRARIQLSQQGIPATVVRSKE